MERATIRVINDVQDHAYVHLRLSTMLRDQERFLLNIYFYSDLVWRMQLSIVKNSCCKLREFSTFNAF